MAQKFIVPITVRQLASAGSDAFTIYVDQDVYSRIQIQAGGRIVWGSGDAALDTNLYRDAANVLKTDDTFKAAGLFVSGTEIDPAGAASDQVLKFNGTKFVPGTVSTVGLLNDLTDVTTASVAVGDVLTWNGTYWTNEEPTGGGASVTVSESAPVSPVAGDLWFDSILGVMFIYYDSVWVEVGGGGVVNFVLDTVTAKGDLIVGTADGAADNLTVGSNGTYLKANSSTATGLEWASVPVIDAAAIISAAGGDGTNGQALTTNGTGTLDFTTIVGTTEASIISAVGADGAAGSVLKTNGSGDLSFGDVALGTNTSGDYVASLVAGTGVTLSNNSGETATPTIAIGQSVSASATPTFAGLTLNGNITFEGATADDYETIIAITDPTSDRVIVFPDLTGTVVTTGDTGSITSLMIADGTIVNGDINASAAIAHSKLANTTAGQILLGTTTTGVVTATTISGDITIDGAGVASIAANSVALGTDTTGNYMSDLTQGTGVTITHTPGEGSNATIAIGQAVGTSASVTFANLTVSGDLTVSGTTTSINTETLTVDDNVVVLNNNVTGSPTENSGIEIERGTSPNVLLRWNESTDKWEFTNDGSTYNNLGAGGATISDTAPASPVAGQLWFDSTVGKTFVYYDSQWIEVGGVGTGARMVSSSSAPASPLEGSMWFDTDTAQTFVYYDSSWVEIGASGITASVQDSAPASPVSGQIWFNSLTGGTYVYYGTNWIEVGASPFSALVNTINTKGDLLVGTADNTIGGLAVGSADQVLTVDSSTATGLKWATPTTYATTGKSIAMSIVFGGG